MASTARKSSTQAKVGRVRVYQNMGTFSGYTEELKKLERFLDYQLTRFKIQHKLTGEWSLMVYVSREEVPKKA